MEYVLCSRSTANLSFYLHESFQTPFIFILYLASVLFFSDGRCCQQSRSVCFLSLKILHLDFTVLHLGMLMCFTSPFQSLNFVTKIQFRRVFVLFKVFDSIVQKDVDNHTVAGKCESSQECVILIEYSVLRKAFPLRSK